MSSIGRNPGEMMKYWKYLLVLMSFAANVQAQGEVNFIDTIGNMDISKIWTTSTILDGGGSEAVPRPEPIGFIGDEYQRFYVHLLSVIQNHHDPLEYFVYGKSRVKSNVCSFQGTFHIDGAKIFKEGHMPGMTQGYVAGEYLLYENPGESGAGMFKGRFRSNFYMDADNRIQYDALMLAADGFENNQFEGQWISYKTKKTKKCNWGDFRIPDSGALDSGDGMFQVADRFRKFGWETYDPHATDDSEKGWWSRCD